MLKESSHLAFILNPPALFIGRFFEVWETYRYDRYPQDRSRRSSTALALETRLGIKSMRRLRDSSDSGYRAGNSSGCPCPGLFRNSRSPLFLTFILARNSDAFWMPHSSESGDAGV